MLMNFVAFALVLFFAGMSVEVEENHLGSDPTRTSRLFNLLACGFFFVAALANWYLGRLQGREEGLRQVARGQSKGSAGN
jgi:hypothetical protein